MSVLSIYRVGKEETIKGDEVIRRTKLKFVISYHGVTVECVNDFRDLNKIAKATNYNVSKKAILEKIAELREQYADEEEIPLIDYVKEKYADRLNEIEKDPFAWILRRDD